MGFIRDKLGQAFDDFLLLLQPPSIELSAVLQELLGDSPKVVDLGCGEGNHLRRLNRPSDSWWLGVDSHQQSLDEALGAGIYDQTECANIIEWLENQPSSSVDTILASCVIEHLEKDDGQMLAEEMKRVSSRCAIIFTPNGYVPQPGSAENPANAHRSGWTVKELRDLGYQVDIGLYGLRGLRTSFGLPTIKPRMFGDLVAKSTSRLVYNHPKYAYQVVGVFRKKPSRSEV